MEYENRFRFSVASAREYAKDCLNGYNGLDVPHIILTPCALFYAFFNAKKDPATGKYLLN
jgi:hypothetical protein